jgi:hypothetical protein
MPLSFPTNPTAGQTTTQNGRTYSWSGYAWEFITQNVNSARSSLTTTSGTLTLSITGGYVPGYLDLFQNGVKLLSGSDYTATDGTSVTLANSAPSGTTIEYITLLPSINNNLYTKLDSISSSFNGSSTSFGLAVSGTPYYPVSANTLGIYVGGVAQEPISSYSVSGSNIIFTEAPSSGLTFWGVGYGTTAVATLNGIVPGSSGSPAISSSNDLTTGFYFPSSGNISVAGNLGIGTNSPSTNLDINSNKFRVRNSKTPSSAIDTGNMGDICWDSSYIYICTSTNTWMRSLISSWDSLFSSVTLLLHCDGSNGGTIFTDSSQYSQTATRIGSAQTSTAQSKFGGASLLLNGTTDYVRFPSSDNFYFSGDFTIEAWIRLSAYPSAYLGSYGATIISRDDSSSGTSTYGWNLDISGSSAQTLDLTLTNTSGTRTAISGTANFSLNTWYHVAAARSGNTVYLYKDGVLLNSGGTSYTSALPNNPTTLKVGALDWDNNYKYWFPGNIDDVRITKAARYPNGLTFTPSSLPFPNQ